MKMICFLLWMYLHVFILVSAETNWHFLQDLMTFPGFHPSACNIISCNEFDSINLIKILSTGFQRFVAVHGTDKALGPFAEEPQIFILDLQCPEAMAVLQQAEDLNLFGKPFQWSLLGSGTVFGADQKTENISENGENWVWPFLETLTILTDSDVKVVEKSSHEKITVTGVYKIRNGVVREPLAEWSSKEGFVIFNPKSIPTRRWNLQGVTLPSSIVITQPDSLKHLEDMVDKHVDTTSKVSYNMVNLFGDLFNASINYKIDKEWGVFVNGSWTGMVGDLERKEIEFSAAPLFLQKNRMGIVEYYASVTPTSTKFIFLSPPLSYSNNIFAMPFDTTVWYCCLVTVSISCFFLFTALNYEKTHLKVGEKQTEKDSKISFTEILIINIGAFCLQGTVAQTKNPPGRIITLFLYLAYLFLNISYSASIVAILQSSDTSIQTLTDFLKSPLKAGADEVAYSQYYFKNSDGDVRKAIYATKIAPKGERPHFLPVEEGIKRVRKGFYGYHVEVSVGYQVIQKTFTEEEKCGVQELKDSFFGFSDPWIVMKKRSPYAEHFKIGMKLCIERGFKSRFVRRFYTKKPVCSSKSSRFGSVGIIDCYYAFMLLSGGLITSFLIMLLEISYRKYLIQRERRRHLSQKEFIPEIEFLN